MKFHNFWSNLKGSGFGAVTSTIYVVESFVAVEEVDSLILGSTFSECAAI